MYVCMVWQIDLISINKTTKLLVQHLARPDPHRCSWQQDSMLSPHTVQISVDVRELAVQCVQLRCLWFVFKLNS